MENEFLFSALLMLSYKLDQKRWPMSLETASVAELEPIKEAFVEWIEVFPDFKGGLTPEIMEDTFNTVKSILTNPIIDGTLFWCKNVKSSPSSFWILFLHYFGSHVHPDFARLVYASSTVAYGGADSER